MKDVSSASNRWARRHLFWLVVVGSLFVEIGWTSPQTDENNTRNKGNAMAVATFGNGCFWCTEAVFQQLRGVESVAPGYCGGKTEHPTYKEVCTGSTGHAEVIRITYDPQQVSFDKLLEVFWKSHDPTTLNRQGNDVGTQYRSVVFYHDDSQKELAEKYKSKLDSSGIFPQPIVTEVTPFETFYAAEDYHRDYYNQHGTQPYCAAIIRPKVDKIRQLFADDLKSAP